jgi:hypothetical protein
MFFASASVVTLAANGTDPEACVIDALKSGAPSNNPNLLQHECVEQFIHANENNVDPVTQLGSPYALTGFVYNVGFGLTVRLVNQSTTYRILFIDIEITDRTTNRSNRYRFDTILPVGFGKVALFHGDIVEPVDANFFKRYNWTLLTAWGVK